MFDLIQFSNTMSHNICDQNTTVPPTIEAALDQPCFTECRSAPSCMFLALSDGKAFGGQLPDMIETASFEKRWACDKAYYLVDESKSTYNVHREGRTSWGTVHLELQEVRCRVELNTLRINMEAAERTKSEPQTHKLYTEKVQFTFGSNLGSGL